MNKIAAIVDSLSVSQCAHSLINSFNELRKDNDVYCFYTNLSPFVVEPKFAVMNVFHAGSFHGNIFATNIFGGKILTELKTNSRKFLYLWDLEWIRSPMDFKENLKILNSPSLEIVARSSGHALLIENYTNKIVKHVVSDWEPQKLLEIINGRTTNNQ
jgi:hypothetical protein